MTFLNGGALWGLLALAGIPLLIHWLSRRFPKKFIFSSLDDIKRTLAGRSRIRNWRHLIYLALRTLALIALTTIARPRRARHARQQRFVIAHACPAFSHASAQMAGGG